MRETWWALLMAIAAASAAGSALAAVSAGGAPVDIPLRQAGRIVVRADANICVRLIAGRRQPGPEDHYWLSLVMAASASGITRLMDERGVPSTHPNGQPRVTEIESSNSVAENCPDPARDLRILLRLTQPRQRAPYRLVVELRLGGASLRKGIDRLRQPVPSHPPIPDNPVGGVVTDYAPPPWSLEGDAEQLSFELAGLVRWETVR